ncbi:MFS transporter, FLVCR family, MFS-domain-containing protein 7 [Fistulifera solaris]|uniref:MFS transporter, FLVCR family, MFS-domain-containing protein 7 n=1 Tax=Fistulifera solaris TaxID=1519565 RepID=A0A1Z5JZW5_FISSO|nr:MFS transporter, FLVCR family, MFS-domain-containing protein 7 [Fistulifera solaris]|eukprot:GAX19583.1 MFS transporter, FLVCR family, MFS-domain-containing protein 7 [Fistulifera solaris]
MRHKQVRFLALVALLFDSHGFVLNGKRKLVEVPRSKTHVPYFQRPSFAVNHPELDDVQPRVYPQRWIQLGYLAALALLSDWICFSVAATPGIYEETFHHSAASIIDIFLFTNVASSFLVTDTVAKFGLQRVIQCAALLMTVGCWCRSGISFLPFLEGNSLMSYSFFVAGTVLVGAAQPFFQCTPPLLSAKWFASSERATSTAIALNFNQIGIATAFLVGGMMATSPVGLENYFGLIAVLCTLVTGGTLLQFADDPPIPPSLSELEKKRKGEKEPPFLESIQTFFATKGFTHALVAFICSISITNVVGAFIDEVMKRGGITGQLQIDLAGAGFELAILVGGILIGGYVDRTREYKKVTMACLVLSSLFVIPLGLTEHAIGKEPILLLLSLFGLGLTVGSIQPINAELAVDVTYPGDETAVESVQQIGGNLISALLVPIAELAARQDYELVPQIPWAASDIRGDSILLLIITLLTMGYYSLFDAPLRRTMADAEAPEETDETTIPSVLFTVPENDSFIT